MGVTQLWNILEPVKKEGSLCSLRGKRLCVDLSCWICEAHGAKGLKTNVLKPHLRNLFFRIWQLTRCGVKLVFVVDGEPPELKWEAIIKRTQARFGSAGNAVGRGANKYPRKKVGRSNFKRWVNECTTLIHLLGIPYVESAGEAEALCAWLDYHGVVDGCITNDGDAFLYGARTVYKDLCISAKECTLESFCMEEIVSQLGLRRTELVALAVLLGCDYLPQGVPGVGKEMSLKLIQELKGVDLLKRFQEWICPHLCNAELSSIEKSIQKKALKVPGFPNQEVINEFMAPKLSKSKISIPDSYRCPDLKELKEFCLKFMEWPEEYTTEKVLPLVTYWQINPPKYSLAGPDVVRPERIIKSRTQNKVECYEVQWINCGLGESCEPTFTTIETRELVRAAYPDVAQQFEDAEQDRRQKKPARQKKKKPPKPADAVRLVDVCLGDSLDEVCLSMDTLSLSEELSNKAPEDTAEITHKEEKTVSSRFRHMSNEGSSNSVKHSISTKISMDRDDSKKSSMKHPVTSPIQSLPAVDYGKDDVNMASEFLMKEFLKIGSAAADDVKTSPDCHVHPLCKKVNVAGIKKNPAKAKSKVKERFGKEIMSNFQELENLNPNSNDVITVVDSDSEADERHDDLRLKKYQASGKISEVVNYSPSRKHEMAGLSEIGRQRIESNFVDTADYSSSEREVSGKIPTVGNDVLKKHEMAGASGIKEKRKEGRIMASVDFTSEESSEDESWIVDGKDAPANRMRETNSVSSGGNKPPSRKRLSLKIEEKIDEESDHRTPFYWSLATGDEVYSHDLSLVKTPASPPIATQVINEEEKNDKESGHRSPFDWSLATGDNVYTHDFSLVKTPASPPITAQVINEADSPLGDVFVPLSLSERLGKNLKGRESALKTLRSISG
ncbi:uncharacterized protein LOC5517074 [Nematostella vectensis]|uniref:uncharacterized protein LOC5517074 n=1 Tax=Nematostella vectensis TaxID=45351 RepID=UPI00207775DE|nr:uncharacterized protein LOC5517074 [Nematostella vectensis]